MDEDEALQLLKQAEDLRDRAKEIVDRVVEAAPFGEYQNVWYLLTVQYESAEDALKTSRIFCPPSGGIHEW